MSACVPLIVILPAEPAVSSCLPLVVAVLFFQSPILASPAGWSRLAANTKTHKNKWASGHTKWLQKQTEYDYNIQYMLCIYTVLLLCKDTCSTWILSWSTKLSQTAEKQKILQHIWSYGHNTRRPNLLFNCIGLFYQRLAQTMALHTMKFNQCCSNKVSTKMNIDSQRNHLLLGYYSRLCMWVWVTWVTCPRKPALVVVKLTSVTTEMASGGRKGVGFRVARKRRKSSL